MDSVMEEMCASELRKCKAENKYSQYLHRYKSYADDFTLGSLKLTDINKTQIRIRYLSQ